MAISGPMYAAPLVERSTTYVERITNFTTMLENVSFRYSRTRANTGIIIENYLLQNPHKKVYFCIQQTCAD